MKYYYLNEEKKCQIYTEKQSLEVCNPQLGGNSGKEFTNQIIENASDFILASGLLGIVALSFGIKLFRGKK